VVDVQIYHRSEIVGEKEERRRRRNRLIRRIGEKTEEEGP